jgi:sorbitol-specific phosphotransferase system component IIBC
MGIGLLVVGIILFIIGSKQKEKDNQTIINAFAAILATIGALCFDATREAVAHFLGAFLNFFQFIGRGIISIIDFFLQ